LKAQVN